MLLPFHCFHIAGSENQLYFSTDRAESPCPMLPPNSELKKKSELKQLEKANLSLVELKGYNVVDFSYG